MSVPGPTSECVHSRRGYRPRSAISTATSRHRRRRHRAGPWYAQIATATNRDGRIEVFAIGTDAGLHHNWQTTPGGAWSGWAGLGGGITQIATAVNRDGRIEVAAIGADTAALNHIWQLNPGG
jgi:hypothetical protein